MYVPREIGVHHGSNLITTLKLGGKGRKEGKEGKEDEKGGRDGEIAASKMVRNGWQTRSG